VVLWDVARAPHLPRTCLAPCRPSLKTLP